MTVGTIAGPVFAAPDVVFRRPLNVVGDDQIDPSVLVVIEPPCARRPSTLVGDTRLGRDIGEGAIAIIVVKDGAAISRHIKIGIAIIVEVADGNALAVVSLASNSSFLGNVGEGSIAVVVVERTTKWMWRFINVGCRGLDKEKVHQPILVIIKPRDPGPHGLQVVLLVGGGRVLLELQAGTLGNVSKGDG